MASCARAKPLNLDDNTAATVEINGSAAAAQRDDVARVAQRVDQAAARERPSCRMLSLTGWATAVSGQGSVDDRTPGGDQCGHERKTEIAMERRPGGGAERQREEHEKEEKEEEEDDHDFDLSLIHI